MTTLRVRIDQDTATPFVAAFEKQLPFALSKAVNGTAFGTSDQLRAGLGDRFLLRTPQSARYLTRSIKVLEKSVKREGKFTALVGLDPRRNLLAKFEAGGVRTAGELKPFAIPTQELRGTPETVIPKRFFPKNLGLQPYKNIQRGTLLRGAVRRDGTVRRSRTGAVLLKGNYGTFVIDARTTSNPKAWGVYRRLSGRKGDITMIWAYRRQITIPPRLEFYAQGIPIATKLWPIEAQKAIEYALRTAR